MPLESVHSPSSMLQRKQEDSWSPPLQGLEQWNDPGWWWGRAPGLVTHLSDRQFLIYTT